MNVEWSASIAVSALEGVWARLRAQIADLPPVVLITATGFEKAAGGSGKWGHWAPLRWRAGTDLRAQDEVLIAGELFEGGPVRVLATILHEAVHALARARKIKDTSRGSRYHNKRFKVLAESLGLVINHDPSIGWSLTTLPDDVAAERYAAEVELLAPACKGFRQRVLDLSTLRKPKKVKPKDEAELEDEEITSGRRIKVACGCTPVRSFRISPSIFETGGITCNICDQTFGEVA